MPTSDFRQLLGPLPHARNRAPRPKPTLQEHLRLWRREVLMLINEIRYTASALDLARQAVARRDGRWGFAGGNARRHEALQALSRRGLCHSISGLARELRCSRQAAHRLATALEQQGLVSIEPGPRARRSLYVQLSTRGARELASAEQDAHLCLDAIGDELKAGEMRALGVALRRIRERAAALRR
jgi:DNA-binding MarR family transcriptional regulator